MTPFGLVLVARVYILVIMFALRYKFASHVSAIIDSARYSLLNIFMF